MSEQTPSTSLKNSPAKGSRFNQIRLQKHICPRTLLKTITSQQLVAPKMGEIPKVVDSLTERNKKDVKESPAETTVIKCTSKAEPTVEGHQTLHTVWEIDFTEIVYRGH